MWPKKRYFIIFKPMLRSIPVFLLQSFPFRQFGVVLLLGKGVTGKFHKGLVTVWPRGPRAKPHEEAADPQWHHSSEINSSDNWESEARVSQKNHIQFGLCPRLPKNDGCIHEERDARDGPLKLTASCGSHAGGHIVVPTSRRAVRG